MRWERLFPSSSSWSPAAARPPTGPDVDSPDV
jgi:hypothetical protein